MYYDTQHACLFTPPPRPNASFTTERLWLMTAPPINAELRLYIRILKLSITLTLLVIP